MSVQEAIQVPNHSIASKIPDITQTDGEPTILQDVYETYEPEAEKPEVSDYTPEMYDALIMAEVLLPKDDVLISLWFWATLVALT